MGGKIYDPVDLTDVVSSPGKYVGQHLSVTGLVISQPEGDTFLFPSPDSNGILLMGLGRILVDGEYRVQGSLKHVEKPQFVINKTKTKFGDSSDLVNLGDTVNRVGNYYLDVDNIEL